MKNKGAIIAIIAIAILAVVLVIVAIKFESSLIGGALDIVLGAIVLIALVAIVVWMFIYARMQQKK